MPIRFDTNNVMWQFMIHLLDNIYNSLIIAMNFMIDKLMKFPLVTQIPEVRDIWQWMLLLSVMFISLIVCWQFLKRLAGMNNQDIDFKQLMIRAFYMFGFIVLTFPFIDWLVMFNNSLIDALVAKYDIKANINMATTSNPFTNDIFAGVLLVLQLFFVGKIVLGYYFRVIELNFSVIVSPALYVMWINQGWSGYISQWVTRMVTLVFSQFIQVLVLVLYSQMFHKYINNGSWDSLFLALASLITMDQIPSVIQSFVARDNAGTMAVRSLSNGASRAYKVTQFARGPRSFIREWADGLKPRIGRRRK